MSEKSGFFDAHKVSGEWDRTYISEDFARYFSAFVGNGVFAHKSDELQVIQSSPLGMSVTVASGMSWLDGYFYYNDSELPLPIDNADGSLNRIDTIVCRWSAVDRSIRTVVKKGVAAVSPQAPTPQWNSDVRELQLASIRVNAGIVAISQDLITDTRPNTTVCGWVTGLIDQVDTSTLFKQWDAAYEKALNETKAEADVMLASIEKLLTDLEAGTAVELKKLQFTDTVVTVSDFVSDATYPDFPYRAAVQLENVSTSMIPEVVLNVTDAISGNFCPLAACYNGGVYLYAASPPDGDMTIPTILCWRGNG